MIDTRFGSISIALAVQEIVLGAPVTHRLKGIHNRNFLIKIKYKIQVLFINYICFQYLKNCLRLFFIDYTKISFVILSYAFN